MYLVTPKQMKFLESAADKSGNTYEILMENAGKKLAENMFKVCIGFTPCTKDMTYPHYQQVEVYVRLCTKEKENVH